MLKKQIKMASVVNLDDCSVAMPHVMNGNSVNISCDTHGSVRDSSSVVDSVPRCEENDISIISFNMHGFNQGKPSLDIIVSEFEPDFVLLQEHWLTPDRLDSISCHKSYVTFGCSSMDDRLSSGPLQGRPFGGLAILAHHRVAHACRSVAINDRYLVISYGDILLCNVYLPCRGTSDRAMLVESILQDLFDLRENHTGGQCVLGGDLNVDFYDTDTFSVKTLEQFAEAGFKSCYESIIKPLPTYVNNALGHSSVLDYVYVAGGCSVTNLAVLELAVNFSDHCPISCVVTHNNLGLLAPAGQVTPPAVGSGVPSLRWDYCDTRSYYNHTFELLSPLSVRVDALHADMIHKDSGLVCQEIDAICELLTDALSVCARLCVPIVKKSSLKFWWDEELDSLKKEAIESHRIWQLADRPRSGDIFRRRFFARANYRRRIKEGKRLEAVSYTNDLHDCLMTKNNIAFWKSFNAKFGRPNQVTMVNGVSDPVSVLNEFSKHFSELAKPSCSTQAYDLASRYDKMRRDYEGDCFESYQAIDVTCVENSLTSFAMGKACGLDGLSPEHFKHSHPIVYNVLVKLFNSMLFASHVPSVFLTSYTVPIPKSLGVGLRNHGCSDFRGIAISSLLSKLFEKCLINIFNDYLTVSENQFGFKRGVGCSQAIHSVKRVVDFYVAGKGTANLCAIDIKKAYDSVDHIGLFIKLMNRKIPLCLLRLLESWLPNCVTCIKWSGLFSPLFRLGVGVRQGSSLAPVLFSIYIDDVISNDKVASVGFLFAFADDILLISLSVCSLQLMLSIVEADLLTLDLRLNVGKCCAIRIGPRYDKTCAALSTVSDVAIQWCDQIRYLGVNICKAVKFRCDFSPARRSFNRAANALLSKVGSTGSEELLLHLLKIQCVPILLYGCEAVDWSSRELAAMDFAFVRFVMRIFKCSNRLIIDDIMSNFGLLKPSIIIVQRMEKFKVKFSCSSNGICQSVLMLRH